MSLINLFNPPNKQSPDLGYTLNYISFANMDSHLRIARAVQTQYNVTLNIPILDPIPTLAFEEWLGLHQTAHNEMNVPLQINGQDLSELDTDDYEQVKAWVFNHAAEHRTAENKLRIG